MTISPYIKELLENWGRQKTSIDIGHAHECSYCKEYVPRPGEGLILRDFTDVELVSSFIDRKLSRAHTDALKAKFRLRMKPHKAAKFCRLELTHYRVNLQRAVNMVTDHMLPS